MTGHLAGREEDTVWTQDRRPDPRLHTASVRGTLTQAGLLDRVTPEQLFVSVQDAAAHALERLVRPQEQWEWELGGAGLWEGGVSQ